MRQIGKEWFERDVSIALRAIRQSCEGRKIYYETYKTPIMQSTLAGVVNRHDAPTLIKHVGDYRIIANIEDSALRILVVRVK